MRVLCPTCNKKRWCDLGRFNGGDVHGQELANRYNAAGPWVRCRTCLTLWTVEKQELDSSQRKKI